jgi:hypothetical protein
MCQSVKFQRSLVDGIIRIAYYMILTTIYNNNIDAWIPVNSTGKVYYRRASDLS